MRPRRARDLKFRGPLAFNLAETEDERARHTYNARGRSADSVRGSIPFAERDLSSKAVGY
jgi:hypothetical protein